MKRAIITVLIVLSIITAFDRGRSLPRMTEITLAEPVFVIGTDRDNHHSRLTLIFEKIEAGKDTGDDGSQKYTMSSTASTAAAAMENLKKTLPRETAISTADYFLIGEAAARESLSKYTDFLHRNNALRLTASVFIVRGEAAEACEVLTDTKTLDILRNFGEFSGINAVSSELKFFELLSRRAEGNAYAVPALIFKEAGDGKTVVPSGYAVIRDDLLMGFIEAPAARGYNILRNKSSYSTIEIDRGDFHIATRLENANRRIRFDWDGDELTGITAEIEITTSVIDGGNHELDIEGIEREQKRVIFGEVLAAVNASRRYGCDFLGFGEALRMRHPLRWEKLRSNWEEIYARTPVNIEIESRLVKL
jgi:spore germination protein KC